MVPRDHVTRLALTVVEKIKKACDEGWEVELSIETVALNPLCESFAKIGMSNMIHSSLISFLYCRRTGYIPRPNDMASDFGLHPASKLYEVGKYVRRRSKCRFMHINNVLHLCPAAATDNIMFPMPRQ